MIIFRRLIFAGIAFLFISCQEKPKSTSGDSGLTEIPLEYARFFSLFQSDSVTVIRYSDGSPDLVLNENFSRPSSVILVSTTYLSFLDTLNEIGSITGISNPGLVYNKEISELVKQGRIYDVGNDQTLNYERILEINPDMIFIYDFGPSTTAVIDRLTKMGLRVVRVSEFREETPLGKAEWIKFFGAIYNKPELANEIFDGIEMSYNQMLRNQNFTLDNPAVFTGLPWKGEWHQPGGKSFQARFIADAGGSYLWSDNEEVSGITVDREVVFEKAMNAKIWIHPSNAVSLSEIESQDARFTNFSSFRNGMVFNNNLRLNENMGNDYWESGILRPDLILSDLMAIFHPEDFEGHRFYYYRKLE